MKFFTSPTKVVDAERQLLTHLGTCEGTFWVKFCEAYANRKITAHLRHQEGSICYFNFKGKSDHDMVKMGKEFGLPRGFPVIFDLENNTIEANGFFPKFENDDRQQSFADNIRALSVANEQMEIELSVKMSGFLTGAILKKEKGGRIGFKVFSKNSGSEDSPYIIAASALWMSLLDEVTVSVLYSMGIRGVWGECMSKSDQVHGYAVLQNAIVITALAYGISADAERPRTIGGREMREILEAFPRLLESSATSFSIDMQGLQNLEEYRDVMIFTRLQSILGCNDSHLHCVGERVEGLIVRILQGSEVKILKYKFPLYTLVTMCVRDIYTHASKVKNKVSDYLDRWVVDESKRASFGTIICQIIKVMGSLSDDSPIAPWIRAADSVIEPLLNTDGSMTLPEPDDSLVAPWIRVTLPEEAKLPPYVLGKKELNALAAFSDLLPRILAIISKKEMIPQFQSYNGTLSSFLAILSPTDSGKMCSEMDKHFRSWREVMKTPYQKTVKSVETAPVAQKVQKAPVAKKGRQPVPSRIYLSCDEKEPEVELGKKKTVVILRGPTGSGKSFWINKLGRITQVSADEYFRRLGKFDASKLHVAHQKCQEDFMTAVCRGDMTIVVSNTNVNAKDFRVYLEIAYTMGYDVVIEHVDSFGIGIYTMKPEDAWTALSQRLESTDRKESWQGLPEKEVFMKHLTGILANPVPFEEGSLERALEKSFVTTLKTSKTNRYSLHGGSIPLLKRNAILELMKIGVDPKWILKCFLRDKGESHITLASSEQPLPAFEQPELFASDLNPLGIGRVEKDGEITYFLVIDCPPLQDALKKAGLPAFDLHITVAFKNVDIHGVSKGVETLLK